MATGTDWPTIVITGFTAGFTGLTVVAVMAIGIYPTISGRPKVKIVDVGSCGWYRVPIHLGTGIALTITVENKGLTESTFRPRYTVNGADGKEHTWESNNIYTVEPSRRFEQTVWLFLRDSEYALNDDVVLEGNLILNPSGNRRLFWGKRLLKHQLNIPFDQSLSKPFI